MLKIVMLCVIGFCPLFADSIDDERRQDQIRQEGIRDQQRQDQIRRQRQLDDQRRDNR